MSVGRFLRHVFSVDVNMIPAKIAYVLYGAILGLHLPYVVEFFKVVGLTTSQAGFISGIRYASSALAGPVWGIIVDYTGRRKLIMTIIAFGSAFPLFFMPWIARAIHPKVTHVCTNVTSAGNGTLLSATLDACTDAAARHKEVETMFFVFLVITVIGSMFVMCMPGYVDSVVINVVKSTPKETSYGAQRIFGSIGFTVANILGGVATDSYSSPTLTNYTAVFWMYLPCCLLLIPAGCYLVTQANFDAESAAAGKPAAEVEQAKPPVSHDIESGGGTWKNSLVMKVLRLMVKCDVIIFFLTVFMSGLGNSVYMGLSYTLVREEMHVTNTQKTFVVSTGSFSELAIFPFALRIIKKVGAMPCITLGIFSYFLRFLAVSYATEFWMAVVIQLLHGIGFALSWAAMMEYTHQIAPIEISGTIFNMMCGIFYSWSALVGNMVGGKMYDSVGGRMMFRYCALLYAAWTLVMILYYGGKFLKRKHDSKFENTIRYQAGSDDKNNKDDVVGIENPLDVVTDEKIA